MENVKLYFTSRNGTDCRLMLDGTATFDGREVTAADWYQARDLHTFMGGKVHATPAAYAA